MSKMDHAPLTPVGYGQGGATLSCDTVSKATTIPVSADGVTAKYIRIATTGTGYFRLAAATTVAVTTDALFTAGWVEVWPTSKATHFAYASAAGTTVVVVTAVEMG